MRLSGTMTKFWLLPVLLALLMTGGCGSLPKAVAPPKPTPSIPAIAPKAQAVATAVQAGAKPVQKLAVDVKTLPPSPPATLVMADTQAILDWKASLDKPTQELQLAAVATDTAAIEVKKGEAERDAAVKDAQKSASYWQERAEKAESAAQRQLTAWSIFVALGTAAGMCVCFFLLKNVKMGLLVGFVGACAFAILRFFSWYNLHQFQFWSTVGGLAAGYVIIETLWRHYHDGLEWWPAFIRAITTSPAEDFASTAQGSSVSSTAPAAPNPSPPVAPSVPTGSGATTLGGAV